MKELIDQIYGLDYSIVQKAEPRFFISATSPGFFEQKTQVNKFNNRRDLMKAQV